MLPLYKRSLRFMSVPYLRMKKRALVGCLVALALLFLLLARWGGDAGAGSLAATDGGVPRFHADQAPHSEPTPAQLVPAQHQRAGEPAAAPGIGDKPLAADGDAADDGVAAHAPLVVRLLLPLVAGFCFGFLGSVPVAGPTSAMVLKLGIQGKYRAGLTIAVGGAISEATYAGIAFWGFGSFLAGAKFLLPVSKVLGAIMFTLIGLVFLRVDMKPSLDHDMENAQHKKVGRTQSEMLKNVLMGITMSGFNPALLASYTGAIASVYGTGMLEFTLFLAFVFAIGVCCGVSTWFYLLLSLLKKYKKRLKNKTIDMIMRGLGCFLLTLGLLCAKSSIDYFVWGLPESN